MVISREELKEKLQLGTNTIRKWELMGMPVIRINNTVRYDFDEVISWMKNNSEGV